MRPRRAATAMLVFALGLPPAPAEAGLLDLLFGPRPTPRGPAPAPVQLPAFSPRPVDMDPAPRPQRAARPAGGGTRQVCVRLCDGFYYPLDGVATRRGASQADCESSCPGTAMSVYRVSGDNMEEARDPVGQRYGDLDNAFSYRKGLTAACSCQPRADGLRAIQRDMTLRAGDIVVTPTGAIVFRGRGDGEHVGSDFVDIRSPKALSGAVFAQADRVIGFSFREDQARRSAVQLAEHAPQEITVTPLLTGSVLRGAKAELPPVPRVVLPTPLSSHDDLAGAQ